MAGMGAMCPFLDQGVTKMRKLTTLIASGALVASGLFVAPVAAAPEIPEAVNIDDPAGDANTQSGDQVLPVGNVSNVGDILKIWFTNDATKLNVHFQTAIKPPATAYGFDYRVEGSPGGDGANCLRFRTLIPSGALVGGDPLAKVFDMCGDGANWFDNGVEGEVLIEDGPDGTGITTMTFDRSTVPGLAKGDTITAPVAWAYAAVGAADAGFQSIRMDDTKVGTDYALVDGKPAKTPPGKNPVPGKKKGCDNGEGKKRGCEGKGKKSPKPGKPSAGCATFTPGEAGKDKPTVTLTDAATAEKPVEQTVTLEQSTADVEGDPSFDFFNIVVDSIAAEAGLYATFEFPTARDYDLDLLHADGSYAARSHGFNPVGPLYETPLYAGTEGHGGKTTSSSESLVGIKTSDCGGWTIQAGNWLGEGGELTVKLWLGEAQIDPQEPGAEVPE